MESVCCEVTWSKRLEGNEEDEGRGDEETSKQSVIYFSLQILLHSGSSRVIEIIPAARLTEHLSLSFDSL